MATKDAPKPVDRVVMASRTADGTPVQSDGFEFTGDKEFVQAAATEQLSQIAVSAEDNARAREQAADTAGGAGPSLSPEEEERVKRHEELQDAAAKQAAAEVEEKMPDAAPAKRSAEVETTATRSAAKKTG